MGAAALALRRSWVQIPFGPPPLTGLETDLYPQRKSASGHFCKHVAAGGRAAARPDAQHGLEYEGALGLVGLPARGGACEQPSWVVRGHGPMFRGEQITNDVHQARAELRNVRRVCI